MSRSGINYELVKNAAEKIISEGRNPTIEKIRMALGGTGSNSTIAKYLNEWKTDRNIPHPQIASNIPPDPVNAAVNRVWDKLKEESTKEVAQIREASLNEITSIKETLEIKILENNQLQTTFNELSENYHRIKNEKELLQIEIKKTTHDFALLESRFHIVDEKFKLLKQQSHEQLKNLLNQHQSFKTESENHQKNIEKSYHQLLEELKAQFQQERAYLTCTVKELQEELAKVINKNKEAEKEIAVLKETKIQHEIKFKALSKQSVFMQEITEALDAIKENYAEMNQAVHAQQSLQTKIVFSLEKWLEADQKNKVSAKGAMLKSVKESG